MRQGPRNCGAALRRRAVEASADENWNRGDSVHGNYGAEIGWRRDPAAVRQVGYDDRAGAFEDKILGRIESGERHVVIDLAQLDYISSAGLRVIVLAGKRLSAANGKMALCSLKDRVREVFDIARLSSIFSIYGSHDDATRGLQA